MLTHLFVCFAVAHWSKELTKGMFTVTSVTTPSFQYFALLYEIEAKTEEASHSTGVI